jgi:hypothetical protein
VRETEVSGTEHVALQNQARVIVQRRIHLGGEWRVSRWAKDARHLFKDKRWTKDGLRAAIKKEYDIIIEIVDLAQANGCSIYYPFQGNIIGSFRVMSPSRDTYVHLLTQFEQAPELGQDLLEAASMWLGKGLAWSVDCSRNWLRKRKPGSKKNGTPSVLKMAG